MFYNYVNKNGRILAETTVSLKNPLVKLTENLIK